MLLSVASFLYLEYSYFDILIVHCDVHKGSNNYSNYTLCDTT